MIKRTNKAIFFWTKKNKPQVLKLCLMFVSGTLKRIPTDTFPYIISRASTYIALDVLLDASSNRIQNNAKVCVVYVTGRVLI